MDIIIVLLLIVTFYYIGRREGFIDANTNALYPGAWAQLTGNIWVKTIDKREICIPEYSQVIIAGKDKWGRMSIWLVKPLNNIPERKFYDIKSFSKFKIINPYSVGTKTYEEATKSLAKFESSIAHHNIPGLHDLWP